MQKLESHAATEQERYVIKLLPYNTPKLPDIVDAYPELLSGSR